MIRHSSKTDESLGEKLVREYVVPGVIYFGAEDLELKDGHHVIRKASFRKWNLKRNDEWQRFREQLPEIVRLMLYVEKDERLLFSLSDISGRLRPYFRNESATGITFLSLFSHGLLELVRKDSGHTELYAEQAVLNGIKDAERYLAALAGDIVSYDGGNAEIRIIPFRRSCTEQIDDSLEVTYQVDDDFEARFGSGQERLLAEAMEQERRDSARRTIDSTMKRLASMMKEINKGSLEVPDPEE